MNFNKIYIHKELKIPIFYICTNEAETHTFLKSNTFEELDGKTLQQKRREEFLLGRTCVRKCLENINLEINSTLKSNPNGTVQWPKGTRGSIAHSKERVAAIVCPEQEINSIGLDLEHIGRIKNFNSFQEYICNNTEINLFKNSKLPPLSLLTLIFSAKESIYKCLNPIYKKYLGFKDVTIEEINEENGSFKINPQIDKIGHLSSEQFYGYFQFVENYIFTIFLKKSD